MPRKSRAKHARTGEPDDNQTRLLRDTRGATAIQYGLIAALIAQGASVREAALAGVYLHGLAGEIAARNGIGMTASELVEALPEARNRVISEFL